MIIHATQGPLSLVDRLDKDAMLYYTMYLKPPAWVANTEYVEGDIVSPASPTGYYYKVTSGGMSDPTTEPIWSTVEGAITTDNTVEFTSANNNAYISSNGSLVTGTAAFSATKGVPVAHESFTAEGLAEVMVGPVPADVTFFTLTLSFQANVGHPQPITDDRSVIIVIGER